MKYLLLLFALVSLSSCAQLGNVGYSIKTKYGSYKDESLNGVIDGKLKIDLGK